MGEEDAQVVPREQVVQHPNPAAVLLREVRQVLPLPPGWAVEAPQAPDHPDLPSSDRPPLGLVLQEPHAMRPREAGHIGGMVVRILVVPEHGGDRRGDPSSDRLEDRPVPLQIVPVCRVAREQDQVDGSEPVQVRGDGREVLVPMDVSDGREPHRPSNAGGVDEPFPAVRTRG